MANDKKWIDWNKPITILGLLSIAIVVGIYFLTRTKPPGCFRFDDGTTQKWTLDQVYDSSSNPPKKITSLASGNPPNHVNYTPFTLANHQNIALEAGTSMFLVIDKNVKSADIYLESPDLSNDQKWQNIEGYSIDVRREFTSPLLPDWPSFFHVQLELKVIVMSDNSEHLLSETDKAGKFKFHELKLNTPYSLKWEWGKKLNVGGKSLTSSGYKVKGIRIRYSMPGYVSMKQGVGEYWYRGKWKIGNVCPVK